VDAGARPAWLRRAELGALAGVSLVALAGWLVVHVLPTYDSLSSLVWGREILHGTVPTFSAAGAPTEHPLWLALSTVLAVFGNAGARLMTLVSIAMFVVLLAGVYVLGRSVFGWVAGAIAAAILATRLDFDFWAAFAFVDLPFLAAIVWAAALEAQRPRRGGVVWALLIAAGLLRPEGWLFAAAYGVWVGWRASGRERLRIVALVAAAPVIWALVDLIVTGDPTFSLTYTQTAAGDLRRTIGITQIPGATREMFDEVIKLPVTIAGVIGLGVAIVEHRRNLAALRVPLALLALGVAAFAGVLAAGVSQVNRYGATAAIALLMFAAALVARLLRRPTTTAGWAISGVTVALVIGAAVWTVPRLHPRHAFDEVTFRSAVELDLRRALATPEFRHGRNCGPVIVPSHKLVPLVRWLLHARNSDVISRTNLHGRGALQGAVHGVALIELGYRLNLDPAYGPYASKPEEYPLFSTVPPPGYDWVGRTQRFAVYASCPGLA
jgi:hypothetical protein